MAFKAGRPVFHRNHAMIAITDMAKYGIKSGDEIPAGIKPYVVRGYYNQRRIGYKGHKWTEYALEMYRTGKQIRPFAFYATREEAKASKKPDESWPSHKDYKAPAAPAPAEKPKKEIKRDAKGRIVSSKKKEAAE